MGKNKLKKFAEMETFHNVFQPPYEPMAGHWRDRYFQNNHPIILELGCGRGEYTVGMAERYPEKNFIEAEQKELRNVAFLRTNIEFITEFFAADEVDEIWITFCDPQMKKATKRLTSTYFMQRYQRIVKPNGLIHLKTDSPFLYTYTTEMLRLNPYPVLCSTDDLYGEKSDEATVPVQGKAIALYADAKALQTHYEKQWLDRGMSIKYIEWQLSPLTAWEEPTIEIEKDTYRSYGRNYQTSSDI